MAKKKAAKKKSKGNRLKHEGKGKNELQENQEAKAQQIEELTAMSAIFQDDCKVLAEDPYIEYCLQIDPHSNAGESQGASYSILLNIRYVANYPHSPPIIRLESKGSLDDSETEALHKRLMEQAASTAKEGRVMVFNLVESVQEFLTDLQAKADAASELHAEATVQLKEAVKSKNDILTNVQGLGEYEDSVDIGLLFDWWGEGDLFGGSSGDWSDVGLRQKQLQCTSSSVAAHEGSMPGGSNPAGSAGSHDVKSGEVNGGEDGSGGDVLDSESQTEDGSKPGIGLDSDDEEEDENSSLAESSGEDESSESEVSSESSLSAEAVSKLLDELGGHSMNPAGESQGGHSPASQFLQTTSWDFQDELDKLRRDLILAQLLRLATSPKGPLSNTLPALTSQLTSSGVLPHWTARLLSSNPALLDRAFHIVFREERGDETLPLTLHRFWQLSVEGLGDGRQSGAGSEAGLEAPGSASRYREDFEEISLLGQGGFGRVVLCVNKLDGRKYAVKKIPLKGKASALNSKILREVATLSGLQHQHIVRYYQAWFETEDGTVGPQITSLGNTLGSYVDSWGEYGSGETGKDGQQEDSGGQANYLYIQMEYCPRTLRQVLESAAQAADKALMWRAFRQVVEGLSHIHSQGVIHRDLTPNNIFFDPRGDVKIGDFGLAKFANLDRLDGAGLLSRDAASQPAQDTVAGASAVPGGSLSTVTGQVGTFFYTAPELEQAWPHVDAKVDMYSLGVVLFELFHPFDTAMERVHTLSDLKNKKLPSEWVERNPGVSQLVLWLTQQAAADRPSAMAVLRSDLLPPRMEDEALNDILRSIQGGDNPTVVERLMAAVLHADRERSHADSAAPPAAPAQPTRSSAGLNAVRMVGTRERVLRVLRSVFERHGAVPIESHTVELLPASEKASLLTSVKVADESGRIVHLRHDARLPLARWIAATESTSLKRYELSPVFRRSVGPQAPRELLQGDFDIVGGDPILATAECIKVCVESLMELPCVRVTEVRLNHRLLLSYVWAWAGVAPQQASKLAQVLSVLACSPPGSPARRAWWPLLRAQLLQGVGVSRATVDKLQGVESRWSGEPTAAIAKLRSSLPLCGEAVGQALDEVCSLVSYLAVWDMGAELVTLDPVMSPTQDHSSSLFFQVHVQSTSLSPGPPTCVAVGGGFSALLRGLWSSQSLARCPSAVGLTLAVQKLVALETERVRALDVGRAGEEDGRRAVLVCSRGGGGLVRERMKLADELWQAGIKAEYMCASSPSLTEQYEYASEHGIKTLLILNEAALSTAMVKVRHLDLRSEKEVPLVDVVKYFQEAFPQSVLGGSSSSGRRKPHR